LTKYLGDWYEIARLPVFFETGCSNVVASYSLGANGVINVKNSCQVLGNTSVANGRALAVGRVEWDGTDLILSPGQIKVSFFGNFFGPYWVLDLDTVGYEWAMIGSPNRNTLWILSRTKSMNPLVYDALVEKARNLNYPIWNLQKTIQT
jgi:apolipoprotein D and lipocalin family protein